MFYMRRELCGDVLPNDLILYNPPWRRFTVYSRKECIEEKDYVYFEPSLNRIESMFIPVARVFAKKNILITNAHTGAFAYGYKKDDSLKDIKFKFVTVDPNWYTTDVNPKNITYVPMRIFINTDTNNCEKLEEAIKQYPICGWKLRYAYESSISGRAFTDNKNEINDEFYEVVLEDESNVHDFDQNNIGMTYRHLNMMLAKLEILSEWIEFRLK